MKQRWHWRAVASFDITKGEHILSVFAEFYNACLVHPLYYSRKVHTVQSSLPVLFFHQFQPVYVPIKLNYGLHLEKKRLSEGFSKINWSEEYGDPSEETLLLPMLYADIDFWKSERLYSPLPNNETTSLLPSSLTIYFAGARRSVFWSLTVYSRSLFQKSISVEAEYALENSKNAFLTAGVDANHNSILWEHTQACVFMWRYVQIRRLRFVSVYKNLN